MNKFKDYIIPIKGLKEGVHNFKFSINKKFFDHYDFLEVGKSEADVNVELTISPFVLTFKINISGYITLACDRCLDEYKEYINITNTLFGKFSKDADLSEDIISISEEDNEIYLSQYIFEFINLGLPAKRVHPLNNDGESTCNIKMIEKLETFYHKVEEKKIDPRWSKLKNFKNGAS